MTPSQLQSLQALFKPQTVLTDTDSLHAKRFDRWCIKHYRDWQGHTIPTGACVVQPSSISEVQTLMTFANDQGLAVIPFGLGVAFAVESSPEPAISFLISDSSTKSRRLIPLTY